MTILIVPRQVITANVISPQNVDVTLLYDGGTSNVSGPKEPAHSVNANVQSEGGAKAEIVEPSHVKVTLLHGQGPRGPKGDDGASGGFLRYEFPASLEWVVEHGKNTKMFIERVSDLEGNRLLAPVNVIDEMSFRVQLAEPIAGFVDVIFGVVT